MRTDYLLIDYENVQPDALSLLEAEHFKVLVFVGANQAKISFDAAEALQRLGSKAEYIRISGNGPNALDFHIAFYIGRLAEKDPTAFFHLISKDTGFDPLIAHLKTQKISVVRSGAVGNLRVVKTVKAPKAKSPGEKLAVIVTNLRQLGVSKPRTTDRLLSSINAYFQKQLSEDEARAILDQLKSKGYVAIEGNKVTYSLPGSERPPAPPASIAKVVKQGVTPKPPVSVPKAPASLEQAQFALHPSPRKTRP